MNEQYWYEIALQAAFGLTAITLIYTCVANAPYGRYARAGYGPTIDNALSWLLMESPSAILPIVYVVISRRFDAVTLLFLALWEAHYLHRTFVYPWLIRGRGARVPVLVTISATGFTSLNAYLNFRYLTAFAPERSSAWLTDPRFVLGALMFVTGYMINRRADQTLRSLRAPGETGYKIPYGGMYRWISCPNYFGELVTWCGWALLTWSVPGLFFAMYSAVNLVPRAVAHHRDYRLRFPEYPPERRAVLPFLL